MPLTKDCRHNEDNPCHDKELARINRAIGQMEGVKRMISERRYCPEILALLKGVRSAVKAVENNILKRHLESCVARSFSNEEERDRKIAEIKEMLDRFQE
ncbi:MAG: metal-sensitive transcriptional regulator [Rickettsiales bacterium]|jgi:DNA-binding FrmR family transcriptional regulator|nr:metal-sensitive transcriptional regulator [Rickettsiales bacterium]